MQIYIIRHGETKANEESRFQGWVDNPLNPSGIELAEITGQAMKKLGFHFDAAFTSPLMRARQTAEAVLRESGNGDCPVTVDARIKELNLGDWEGKLLKPLDPAIDAAAVKRYFENPIGVGRVPGGESAEEVMARTQSFLKELAEQDYETVLVSTHGCALRCMLNFLYPDPSDFWQGQVPFNCSVSRVEAVNGVLTLKEKDRLYFDKSLCVDRYANLSE